MGTKQERHNINTIAEILIDKLNDLEKLSLVVKEASNKKIEVDLSDLKDIVKLQEKRELEFINSLQNLVKKTRKSKPNWLVVFQTLLIAFSTVVSVYVLKQNYEDPKIKGVNLIEYKSNTKNN